MSPRAHLVLVLLGGLVFGPAAEARRRDALGLEPPDRSQQAPDGLVDRRPHRTPAQAAREAQSRYGGGRVLSVDAAEGGYRVKLERHGDVRVVFIPDR
ncbi:MAG: hypothetical protein ACT4QA_09615 [Panacagrimonas sp.]